MIKLCGANWSACDALSRLGPLRRYCPHRLLILVTWGELVIRSLLVTAWRSGERRSGDPMLIAPLYSQGIPRSDLSSHVTMQVHGVRFDGTSRTRALTRGTRARAGVRARR